MFYGYSHPGAKAPSKGVSWPTWEREGPFHWQSAPPHETAWHVGACTSPLKPCAAERQTRQQAMGDLVSEYPAGHVSPGPASLRSKRLFRPVSFTYINRSHN